MRSSRRLQGSSGTQVNGLPLHLVSGDGHEATKAVGQRVGIEESHGGLLPEDKAAFLTRFQSENRHVAMVGDGINDAPALARQILASAFRQATTLARKQAASP